MLQEEESFLGGVGYGGLTIHRLMVWVIEPLARMKMLASLVDICKGTHFTICNCSLNNCFLFMTISDVI